MIWVLVADSLTCSKCLLRKLRYITLYLYVLDCVLSRRQNLTKDEHTLVKNYINIMVAHNSLIMFILSGDKLENCLPHLVDQWSVEV
jgi:hypothetical protein